MLAVLIGVGLLFTLGSRCVQLRYFGRMFRVLKGATHHEKGHVSSFQALVVSVAGRVGAGNIAGVAVAITLGGPGAIFWMWIVALMGMATSFFECSLAQLFKRYEPDGTYRGGPAFYLVHGLRQRGLAVLFSILLLLTFGFGFSSLQSYVIATSLNASFGLSTWLVGVTTGVLFAITIFGGIKRIAVVAEFLVPLMAVSYFVVALVVIALNLEALPGLIVSIVKNALGLESAVGGGLGAIIMQGVKRGLLSNEAGLGSAPNVAAVAYVRHPASQGVVQAFSVFIDTLIMCTCTAFIILLSDVYQAGGENVAGVALTQSAMASHLGIWGEWFVSIALTLFAFSSIMYNYYLGENSVGFLSQDNRYLINVFRLAMVLLVLWGSLQDLGTVFGFADLTMALLGLVNLLALVGLYRVGIRLLRDYDEQLKTVDQPVFNPDAFADLDIDHRAWAN